MLVQLLSNVSFYLPEFITVLTMCGLIIIESAYKDEEDGRLFLNIFGIIGLSVVLILLFLNMNVSPKELFSGLVVLDKFSTIIKVFMVIGTMATFYLAAISKEVYTDLKGEYVFMTVGVLLGGMLLASANNLLSIYIGIETLSILSYVLTSFKKNEATSQEAGIKYALYGAVAAGVMLFGMSHLYGVFGSLNLSEIAVKIPTLTGVEISTAAMLMILFFAGIGFKIAAFPFQMWSPDVYQGAPTPVTAFFAIVPKVAGLAVLARVSFVLFSKDSDLSGIWVNFLTAISVLTMTVGNVSALMQDSVKRMLAYSSIGHVGMIIMGVLVLNQSGLDALLFYSLIYMVMTLIAFLIVSIVYNQYSEDNYVHFKGMIKKYPIPTIIFATVLFSLAGLPPLAGFIAKFNMLNVAISKGYYFLAFMAALNSVIALYYYLRLIKMMVIEEPENTSTIKDMGFLNQFIVSLMVVPIILFGVFWNISFEWVQNAKIFFQ